MGTRGFLGNSSGGGGGGTSSVTLSGLFSAMGGEDNLTAFAGGGQASATQLSATVSNHRVTTVATAGDSVKLPAATLGAVHYVRNDAAVNNMQVFAALTETINGVASATGITQSVGMGIYYECTTAGQWTTTPVSLLIVTKNGSHAVGIQVTGQGFVGMGRNSSIGGLNFYGGTITPSDTNSEALLISGAPPSFVLSSTLKLNWSSSNVTQAVDVGIVRNAAGLLEVNSGTTGTFRDVKVRQYYADFTITAGGTTGNQTINKARGTVNIAAAGTTVTVTNSLCTTSSIVLAVIRTADATARINNVVPAAGSFVINIASATAEVSIGFEVLGTA